MGKTLRKEPKEETTQVTKLKNKLQDRKEQIIRLKRTIREIEKKLEKYQKGIIGTSDTGKPKKKEKVIVDKKTADEQKRKELIERLRSEFVKKQD